MRLSSARPVASAAVQPAQRQYVLAVKSSSNSGTSSRRLVMPCSIAPSASSAAAATRPGTPGLDREQIRALTQDYNLRMQDQMGWHDRPFAYDISRGLYYHEILPGLFCGSQPRHEHDCDELHRELGTTTVLSLQQEKDQHHWNVQPEVIRKRLAHHGIDFVRKPVRDFDPHSLRKVLPAAVQTLHEAHSNGGRVYVHCTAGLGRAPGVIIAYLYWFYDLSLDEAYELLTSIRPCGPKKEAIRGATYDLHHPHHMDGFDRLPKDAFGWLGPGERQAVQHKVTNGHFHYHH